MVDERNAVPLVAGIILSAVGDELAQPVLLGVVGGPTVYLVGAVLFKRALRGWFQLSHLVGIASLIALMGVGSSLSRLGVAAGMTMVLVIVALWESLALRSGTAEAVP